jgi:hypothetical protein
MQYWVIALSIAGFGLTAAGLVGAFSTVRGDYLRALRQEARMRYLNGRMTREHAKFRSLPEDAPKIWQQWSTERRARQWRFWKLPMLRLADLDVAPVTAGRVALAQAFASVKSDLIWVGIGLVCATAASILSAIASIQSGTA